jgi:hypothetical protein
LLFFNFSDVLYEKFSKKFLISRELEGIFCPKSHLNSRTIFQENSIFSRFCETLLKKFSHREWLFNQIPIFQISQSIRKTEKVKHFPEKNCAKNYVGKEENEFMEELSKTCIKSINKILLKKDCNKKFSHSQ